MNVIARNAFLRASTFIIDIDDTAPELERLLRLFPLIGPPFANLLQWYRARNIVVGVENELLHRHRADLSVWSDTMEKALFAQSICELAMLEMGWPNDHFLPTDPASVVFWNHRDSLDFATTIRDIEINYGIKVGGQDITAWSEMSLGEIVDNLWISRVYMDSDRKSWPPTPQTSFDQSSD